MIIEPETVDTDLEKLREEMDGYYQTMEGFQTGDPRDNLMDLSAFSARMSHARTHIIRNGNVKIATNFRTKELDPFISECDRQFKIWSRLITVAQMDWDISRGGV